MKQSEPFFVEYIRKNYLEWSTVKINLNEFNPLSLVIKFFECHKLLKMVTIIHHGLRKLFKMYWKPYIFGKNSETYKKQKDLKKTKKSLKNRKTDLNEWN